MPNICFIKVSGDRILSQYREDQDYSNFGPIADAILAESNSLHEDSRTMVGHACADVDALRAAHAAGAVFCDGPDCDFDVMLKSSVTTQTIVPPEGVDVADIPDTDWVVCHA